MLTVSFVLSVQSHMLTRTLTRDIITPLDPFQAITLQIPRCFPQAETDKGYDWHTEQAIK